MLPTSAGVKIVWGVPAEVVEIHNDQIKNYGDSAGTRDIRLLESAIAQPQASFEGQWIHGDFYEMAAAYAYHITQDHPFVDGNKRVGLAAALVFLDLNGISVLDPKGKLFDAMIKVSSGKMLKKDFADLLRNL